MPMCAAVGCSNRREKGFLMKSFPRDKVRRALWAAQVNRASWQPSDRSCLCEIHFESNMWIPGTKKLKSSAIPTLLLQERKNCRNSTKKYHVDSDDNPPEDEEEENLVVLNSCTSNDDQDPLALTDECSTDINKEPSVPTQPEVLCREELEIWTEDCITGMQRIEKYRNLLENENTNSSDKLLDFDEPETDSTNNNEVEEPSKTLATAENEQETSTIPQNSMELSNSNKRKSDESETEETENHHKKVAVLPCSEIELEKDTVAKI